jgi:hypothetical protein
MQEKDYATEVSDEIVDTNPTTAVVPATAAAGTRLANPFVLFRQQNQSGGFFKGDLIKLDHTYGEFYRARGEIKTPIDDGERLITNPVEMIDVWTRFADGKVIDRRVYRTANGEFAPKRHELGDTDKDRWPKGKDPWQRQVLLPMRGDDNEVCAFSATGQGAIAEIAELVGMYGEADRHGKFPIIELDTRSFESQHGTTIYVPIFRLKDWGYWEPDTPAPEARPVPIPPPAPPTPPSSSTFKPAAIAKRNDMDDEIPF